MLSQVKVGIMTGAILPGGHPPPQKGGCAPWHGQLGQNLGLCSC